MIKILVPVDFSATSKNALRYATKLFGQESTEITVLNIYGTESTATLMKSMDDILINDAKSQINKLIDDIKMDAPNVEFKTSLVKNYAVSTISSLGDSGDFDYIVMGTKGASGLKEVFMGSVAGGVISKTSAPVIVVPLDYNFEDLSNVVFAIGNSSLEDSSILKPLSKLVESNKSSLEVLHVSDHEADLEEALNYLKDLNPTLTQEDNQGDLNKQLNTHAVNNQTDLLCLIRTKKSFFDRMFNGSVTLKQTFNSTAPLLILHE